MLKKFFIYLYFSRLFGLDRFRSTLSLGFNRFFDRVLQLQSILSRFINSSGLVTCLTFASLLSAVYLCYIAGSLFFLGIFISSSRACSLARTSAFIASKDLSSLAVRYASLFEASLTRRCSSRFFSCSYSSCFFCKQRRCFKRFTRMVDKNFLTAL